MLCSAPLMTIGYIIFLATDNAKARYGAIFLIMAGAFSFGALCESKYGSVIVVSLMSLAHLQAMHGLR